MPQGCHPSKQLVGKEGSMFWSIILLLLRCLMPHSVWPVLPNFVPTTTLLHFFPIICPAPWQQPALRPALSHSILCSDTRLFFLMLILPFFFFFLMDSCVEYGGSQARGLIGATAASLHHSHSNAGSELSLQSIPQLTATPDL